LPDYVKIIDFGISKFRSLLGDAQHHETRTGTVIGTPSYMSPEQARGLREADSRSDIHAVGVILYEAVTGRLPFEGTSTTDLLFKIYLSEPLPIAMLAGDVDPAFCTLIMKALSKDPGQRFATAGEFIAALDAWRQTGTGVAVQPPAAGHATLLEPPHAALPPVAALRAPPPQTQGSWGGATPGATGSPRKRSPWRTGLVLVVAVAAVGLGGFALWTMRGAPHPDNTAAGATVKPTTGSVPPAPLPAPLPSEPAVPAPPVSAASVVNPILAPSAAPSATPSEPHRARAGPRTAKTAAPQPTPQPPTNPFEER